MPLGLGLGLMGGSLLGQLFSRYSSTGRKYKRAQDAAEKARAQAALADVQAQEQQMLEDQPYEQAMTRQGFAARRFGKSSDPMDIANQGMRRLTNSQARQLAAVRRNKGLAHRGLSLIKQRRKYEKRMMPWEILGSMQSSLAGAAPFFGSFGGKDD